MEETVLGKAIGLDFGTTNSALALVTSDGAVQLAQFSGAATFRSILHFDEHDGARTSKLRVVAGPDAI
jgi:molecular chaperone DnaK (HSP70)